MRILPTGLPGPIPIGPIGKIGKPRPGAPSENPPGRTGPARRAASRDAPGAAPGRVLVCRHCGRLVTRPEARTVIDGSHVHVFCNPLGVVFEVACFAFATGLRPEGGAHETFSWFPGHAWRIVLCAGCGEHLGWQFLARGGGGFHGLLPNRLLETDAP